MTTPQHLSDRYELGEILGFGGMSEVHLARDVRLHRDVAVKVLRADLARDPSFYLRFRREAQNAAALNHPSIVAVYDTGEAETPTGPLPYIVMEYVDGVTLRDIVHTDGPLPPAPRHRDHRRRVPGAELQPPERHHPPRRQAGQHHDQHHQCGQGDGLRYRPCDRRQRQQRHPDRRGDRNRSVPVTRAGPRRRRRRAFRCVLFGLRSLRNPHGRTAFHRRLASCRCLPTCSGRPGPAVAAARRHLRRPRRRRAQGAGQEPRQPVSDRGRDAHRPDSGAQRRETRSAEGAHRRRPQLAAVVQRRLPARRAPTRCRVRFSPTRARTAASVRSAAGSSRWPRWPS